MFLSSVSQALYIECPSQHFVTKLGWPYEIHVCFSWYIISICFAIVLETNNMIHFLCLWCSCLSKIKHNKSTWNLKTLEMQKITNASSLNNWVGLNPFSNCWMFWFQPTSFQCAYQLSILKINNHVALSTNSKPNLKVIIDVQYIFWNFDIANQSNKPFHVVPHKYHGIHLLFLS